MSTTSPQKRRHTTFRSGMRTTRSMARISDGTDSSELPSSSRGSEQRRTISAAPLSPRKARASRANQVDRFDDESPDVSMTPCMESPKKGRFDDFEFELENSNPEVPTRRRRIATRQSTSPSAEVALPRSKTSTTLNHGTATNTLLASRKENSAPPKEEVNAGASPVKPVAALPRSSRLLGTSSYRAPSRESETTATSARSEEPKAIAANVGGAPTSPSQSSPADSKLSTSGRDSNHRLLFGSSDIVVKRNPFQQDIESSDLAALGESRHSPVKRFQPKSEFIISSPDRPDRKPINLLELKPSPGKASRGIFRHNSAHDEDDSDDGWGEDSGSNTMDEIRLVKGPAPQKAEGPSIKKQAPPSSGPAPSTSSSSSKSSLLRSATTVDVKHTLSTETSDALASLEASLARLKAKTRSPPSTAQATKKKEDSGDSTMKRELGAARPAGMTSSRTQIFKKSSFLGDCSAGARSTTADQSADSSGFKRPSGRVSALAKSRESSGDQRSALSSSLASSKSMMSFGAPRLPGFSETTGRSARPLGLPKSRQSSLTLSSGTSAAEEEAAQKEEEARVAEQKRQAELKAAKRKSMSSILSSGMPPPLQRRSDADASTASSSASGSRSSTRAPVSPTATESTAESAEAKKAAKAARRRSLYTYSSIKGDGASGDNSIGNLSTGLVILNSTAAVASEGDSSSAAPKKTRFLRGLTVLVDVRDQDGEDASAAWVEMLKNAGAKVMLRFGERKLTHIVYKSGRPSTLHSYRALEEKPHVVGISWVVACMEQGKKADEKPYLVEVARQAIFQTRKSSMAPKSLPSSASSIRELPKETRKHVEQVKKKLLAHAPVVSSPLRRRVSSRSLLATKLAATSLGEEDGDTSGATESTQGGPEDRANMDDDGDSDGTKLEAYRARVRSVLVQPTAVAA